MKKNVFNINPYNFTTSAFLIGMVLLKNLSSEEQDSIGNWLQLVGLTMQTYASQETVIASLKNKSFENVDNNIEVLKKAIKKISDELEKIDKNNTL